MAGLWKEKKNKDSSSEYEFLEISNFNKPFQRTGFLGMESDGLVANYKCLSFRNKDKYIIITSL